VPLTEVQTGTLFSLAYSASLSVGRMGIFGLAVFGANAHEPHEPAVAASTRYARRSVRRAGVKALGEDLVEGRRMSWLRHCDSSKIVE